MSSVTVEAPAVVDARRDAQGVVEARQLTREFDDVAVVKSLDLTIEPGSIVGLIGPSGCGKTTTVRLLTGLLRPTAGEARLGGVTAMELTAEQRRDIGYLPQIPALFPDLSVWENLGFHASMYGLPLRRRSRLHAMLDWVELDGDRHKKVAQVSGGMQRRLALAASLVHDPAVVFLDEPTAGIDPILREKFWTQFRALGEAGKTLVVTTQYVGEASYCDYVGLLSDGELLLFDTPANLRRAAFDGEVLDVTLRRPASDAEIARLEALPFVIGAIERTGRTTIRVVVDGAADELDTLNARLVEAGLDVESVEEHVVDYDEAFVRVVERHRATLSDAPGEGATPAEEPEPETGPEPGESPTDALPPPVAMDPAAGAPMGGADRARA